MARQGPSDNKRRMTAKRKRILEDDASRHSTHTLDKPFKKCRHTEAPDLLSPLSDELLVRILCFLPLSDLLTLSSVSDRFYHLSGDSQIWKRLYYARFVLPRALRLPGFRNGSARDGKLHYSSRRTIWADGRRGGWVDMCLGARDGESRNWKKQYKLRHNWARGKCAVEELHLGGEPEFPGPGDSARMLVKVLEGTAVTADATTGLRVWDLRTKQLVAQTRLVGVGGALPNPLPTCLALDGRHWPQEGLDIALGFVDGSFGVWRVLPGQKRIVRRYQHKGVGNGELIDIALLYPYILTATKSILISLYTFDVPPPPPPSLSTSNHLEEAGHGGNAKIGTEMEAMRECSPAASPRHNVSKKDKGGNVAQTTNDTSETELLAPYLLTSLRSHTSHPPLALSLREMAGNTIASIAYTFSAIRGWSLGIQELHIHPVTPRGRQPRSEVVTTQLAYTLPVTRSPQHLPISSSSAASDGQPMTASMEDHSQMARPGGPISLSYTHPYLLATMPDNTLILHLCTSGTSSLSISPGIRLWGHTSGISDAEITARGKAVSVSCRGEEIRVWELEGRTNGRSIEVRPTAKLMNDETMAERVSRDGLEDQLDDRRNWVGFDDEMVIVLKESNEGKESLLVYDFT